jgi:hypothetical protein
MNAFAAMTTGAGLGLVCYGSLWLSVRRLVSPTRQRGDFGSPRWRVGLTVPRWRVGLTLGVGRLLRLVLIALTISAIARENPALVPAALAGLWLARRWLLLLASGGRQPPVGIDAVEIDQQGADAPRSPFVEEAHAD